MLTEADSHLGITNRLLARRARRVCLAFELPGRDGPLYLHTGRPVPAAILGADREASRAEFGIAAGDPCLLVFGGSLGARTINEATAEAFAGAGAPERGFHVLHITGTRDYEATAARVADAPRYTLLDYLPNLGGALAACDLALARSGGSVFELTAAGRGAVLVPYPHATADHQHTNARWMAAGGAAIVVEDAELTPDYLGSDVAALMADGDRLGQMAAASRSIAKPDAAERIAAEILTFA